MVPGRRLRLAQCFRRAPAPCVRKRSRRSSDGRSNSQHPDATNVSLSPSMPPTASLCMSGCSGHERSPTRSSVVAPSAQLGQWRRRARTIRQRSFPRFAARRSIPAQAFALKKYRRGTPPVSKMSDNEDATASLGHSEELSVQHSPGATIPEFRQRPDDGAKVPPAVRGQNTGDVFPDDPPRPQSASKPAKLDGQVATRILQAATSSGEGEGLAGSSSGQNVDWSAASFDRREVAKVGNVRIADAPAARSKTDRSRQTMPAGSPAAPRPRSQPQCPNTRCRKSFVMPLYLAGRFVTESRSTATPERTGAAVVIGLVSNRTSVRIRRSSPIDRVLAVSQPNHRNPDHVWKSYIDRSR